MRWSYIFSVLVSVLIGVMFLRYGIKDLTSKYDSVMAKRKSSIFTGRKWRSIYDADECKTPVLYTSRIHGGETMKIYRNKETGKCIVDYRTKSYFSISIGVFFMMVAFFLCVDIYYREYYNY